MSFEHVYTPRGMRNKRASAPMRCPPPSSFNQPPGSRGAAPKLTSRRERLVHSCTIERLVDSSPSRRVTTRKDIRFVNVPFSPRATKYRAIDTANMFQASLAQSPSSGKILSQDIRVVQNAVEGPAASDDAGDTNHRERQETHDGKPCALEDGWLTDSDGESVIDADQGDSSPLERENLHDAGTFVCTTVEDDWERDSVTSFYSYVGAYGDSKISVIDLGSDIRVFDAADDTTMFGTPFTQAHFSGKAAPLVEEPGASDDEENPSSPGHREKYDTKRFACSTLDDDWENGSVSSFHSYVEACSDSNEDVIDLANDSMAFGAIEKIGYGSFYCYSHGDVFQDSWTEAPSTSSAKSTGLSVISKASTVEPSASDCESDESRESEENRIDDFVTVSETVAILTTQDIQEFVARLKAA